MTIKRLILFVSSPITREWNSQSSQSGASRKSNDELHAQVNAQYCVDDYMIWAIGIPWHVLVPVSVYTAVCIGEQPLF